MHRLLETYLSEVSAHLGALPPKRRAEELREMRTHLENAIVVSHELGRSEAEAAANAVAQFGTARDLGENLVPLHGRIDRLRTEHATRQLKHRQYKSFPTVLP